MNCSILVAVILAMVILYIGMLLILHMIYVKMRNIEKKLGISAKSKLNKRNNTSDVRYPQDNIKNDL